MAFRFPPYQHSPGRGTHPYPLFSTDARSRGGLGSTVVHVAPVPHGPGPPKPTHSSPYGGLFTGSLFDQAKKLAAYAFDPYTQQYNALRAQQGTLDATRLAQLQAYIARIAGSFTGVAPQVLAAYQGAAQDQTAFAQGFSDSVKGAVQDSANQDNTLLQQIGAPSGQMIPDSQATGVGDVVYGLGGWIPATSLAAQGAHAYAQAAELPAIIQQRGLSAVSDLLGTQLTAASQLDAAYQQALAGQPQAVLDVLGGLQQRQATNQAAAAKQQQQQFENRVAVSKLNLQSQKDARAYKLQIAKLRTSNRIEAAKFTYQQWIDRQRLGVDWARVQTARTKEDRSYALSVKKVAYDQWLQGKKLGLVSQKQKFDSWYKTTYLRQRSQQIAVGEAQAQARIAQGDERIRIAQENEKLAEARLSMKPPDTFSSNGRAYTWQQTQVGGWAAVPIGPGKPAKPRFTGSQLAHIRSQAADRAYNYFWGVKDKTGNVVAQPLHYQEAISDLLSRGVPLDVAQQALNRWWTRPGLDADVQARQQGKVVWFKPQAAYGRPAVPYQARQGPKGAAAAETAAFTGYPLGTAGKVIGLPYQGSHTLYGNWESDNAIDIAAPVGTPVYAVSDGTIGSQIGSLGSGDPHLGGNRLHLVGGGNEWYYAHLSKLAVTAGQHVKKGDLLGYSGEANGVAHLHIAQRDGSPLGLTKRGRAAQTSATSASAPYDPAAATAPEGARLAARSIAKSRYGWAGNEWDSLDALITGESGWDYTAVNPTSGAAGIGQALGHKLPPGYAKNPLVQIRWMLRYVKQRYGTPSKALAFKQANGWY